MLVSVTEPIFPRMTVQENRFICVFLSVTLSLRENGDGVLSIPR